MNKVKKNNSYKIFHDQKNNYGKKEFQSIDLKNKTIKRILIIKWGGMGDVVISTAIIEDILNCGMDSTADERNGVDEEEEIVEIE